MEKIQESAFIEKVMQKPVLLSSLLSDMTGFDKEENFKILKELSQGKPHDQSLLHKMADKGVLIWIVPAVEQTHLKDLLTLTDDQGSSVLGTLAAHHPENIVGVLLAVSKQDLPDLLLLKGTDGQSVFTRMLENNPDDIGRFLRDLNQEDLLKLLLLKNDKGETTFETLMSKPKEERKVASHISISIRPQNERNGPY